MKALSRLKKIIFRKQVFNRTVAYLTVFSILFPIASPSVALALDNIQIQQDFDLHPLFLNQGTSASEMYQAKPYVEAFAPQGAKTVQGFYKDLWDTRRAALGEVTYVPVSNGGITFFIPLYNNPKQVGSPLVQARYVRAQISGLLGRNLIDGDTDAYKTEVAQLNTLYANALSYVDENPGLVYGTPLNLPQDGGAPVRDMIWPEQRLIHGQQVMVPVVYLTQATVATRRVTDHQIEFVAGATFDGLAIDGVTIKAGRDAFINVLGDLTNNQGHIAGGGELEVAVGGTLSNISGVISAQNDLRIGANNITSKTIVYRYDFGASQGGSFGEIATIQAGGDVTLRAYSDIQLQGAAVNAGGEITLAANGNIYVGGVQYATNSTTRAHGWYKQTSGMEYLRSTLTAAEAIEFIANGQIQIDGAELISDEGHINILAGMGITIQNDWDQSRYVGKYKKGGKKKSEEAYETVAIRALLDAGKGVTLHTEFGDINLTATEINSSAGVEVSAANGSVNLLVAKETDHYSYHAESSTLFTKRTIDKGHVIENVVHNSIVGGLKVSALYGLNVEYEGGQDRTFKGQINQFRQIEELKWMADIYDNPELDVNWTEVEENFDEWSEDNTSLNAAAMAIIAIAVAVATGGAGFASLASMGAIGGTTTATTAALSAGWTSLVTTAVVASTNAAVNGGNFSDIHKAAFDAVVSKDGLKSLAVAMVTAGVMAKIDAKFFKAPTEEAQLSLTNDWISQNPGFSPTQLADFQASMTKTTLTWQVGQAITHSAVKAAAPIIVEGGTLSEFGEDFLIEIAKYGVNTIGKEFATKIGIAAHGNGEQQPPTIGVATQYIAHAALGCSVAVATSAIDHGDTSAAKNSCLSGAGGAVVGEFVAQQYREKILTDIASWAKDKVIAAEGGAAPNELEFRKELDRMRAQGVDIAKLSAAFLAFAVGGDVNLAAAAGENAAENNALVSGLFLLALATIAYMTAVGEGNILIGMSKISDGDHPIGRALREGGTQALELSMQTAPEETLQAMEFLNTVGGVINTGAVWAIETCDSGLGGGCTTVIVAYENIPDEIRKPLEGAGASFSLIIPPAGLSKLKVYKDLGDQNLPVGEMWVDGSHKAWDVKPDEKQIFEGTNLGQTVALLPKTLEQQRELAILAAEARTEIMVDPSILVGLLSEAQLNKMKIDFLARMYLGHAIEKLISEKRLEALEVNPDSVLADMDWTGVSNKPYDFKNPTDDITFEVTTNSKASILKHQDRAEVDIVITYDAFSVEDLKLINGNL
ncbi:hypothetical protein R50072_02930 [Simiduia litorea]